MYLLTQGPSQNFFSEEIQDSPWAVQIQIPEREKSQNIVEVETTTNCYRYMNTPPQCLSRLGYSENKCHVLEIVLLRNHLELSCVFSRELSHRVVGEDLFCVTKYRVWDMWKHARGALAHFLAGSRSKEAFGIS